MAKNRLTTTPETPVEKLMRLQAIAGPVVSIRRAQIIQPRRSSTIRKAVR